MSHDSVAPQMPLDDILRLRETVERLQLAQADHASTVKQLRNQHELLQNILATIPHCVFWKDRNCVFLGCNDHLARDAGLASASEIVGKTDYDLPWRKEESDLFRQHDFEVMRTGTALLNHEETQRHPDGTTRTLLTSKVALRDETGAIIGILGIYADITERKEAEENLKRAHSLLSATLESTTDGILVVDDGGQVRSTNQKFRTMWRIPEELIQSGSDPDLLAYVTEQLVTPDAFLAKVKQLYAEPDAESYDVIRFKDGRVYERYSLPRCVEGKYVGRVWSFRDVTERIRSEEERERLQAQVLHTQKLESLGVLAGGIAHDFNNLLTGILGGTEQALTQLPQDSPVRDTLRHVETAVYRAADLTRQMLAYSGRGRFVVQPLLVSEVVRDIGNLIQASISKKCNLVYHFHSSEVFIEADVSQVRQVVMNLIINASEAIGDQEGLIQVSTGTTYCDCETLAQTYLDEGLPVGRYVFLRVEDDGCGMPPHVKSRLFDPFFTTKFTGRGLGMAAVLGIIRGHRGAIKVESNPGRGTTLTLYFPASDAPVVQQTPPPPAPPAAAIPVASGRVLVVDDEPQVRELTVQVIAQAGYSVLSAVDGVEALQVLRHEGHNIEVVLLDMTMPRMGGKETLEHMRLVPYESKVVLMSGFNEEDVRRSLPDAGDQVLFLQKPYRAEDLLQIIGTAMQSRHSATTLPG